MRSVTMKERFDDARTIAEVRDAGALMAAAISDELGVIVDSQQCRSKVGFVWY